MKQTWEEIRCGRPHLISLSSHLRFIHCPNFSKKSVTTSSVMSPSSRSRLRTATSIRISGKGGNLYGLTFSIVVSDSEGGIVDVDVVVSPERHHDIVSIPVGRATSGNVVVTVIHRRGSAVLAHGPGSGSVGVR